MIEQPPGRCDDHVDAGSKGVFLRPHADAAEHRCGVERRVHGEVVQVFENLRGELPRRRQHQRARRAARAADQLVQDRQQERGGFAAAGHGAGEEIFAGERRRNRVGLNWSGTREPEVLQAANEVGVQVELAERQNVFLLKMC